MYGSGWAARSSRAIARTLILSSLTGWFRAFATPLTVGVLIGATTVSEWFSHKRTTSHDRRLGLSCRAITPAGSEPGPIPPRFPVWAEIAGRCERTTTSPSGLRCRLAYS